MADCKQTLQELEQFLDSELSSDARHAIQGHLDGCMDCLQAFDFEAELRQVIATKCRDEPVPPGLLDRIQACFGLDEDDLGLA
jgi:mycothiol system anti-sigma-R factor